MIKLRVVFMGTPEFAVQTLKTLHATHSVVGVYTQPDRPVGRGLGLKFSAVKDCALECGLPVLQPEKLSAPGEFERLAALLPDVVVIVAYGQILRKNILNLPALGCINIHTSLLPRWRGAAPIQWALLDGDLETGVTTMHLAEKLDAGDILLQKRIPILKEDTSKTLHDRLADLGAELVLPTLEGLVLKNLKGQPQDESGVTYASKLTKEMQWLDPKLSAEALERRVRALSPWPGTSIYLGQRLRVKQARLRQDIQGSVGQVFERAGMILLGTSQGALELQVLQWDGKKEVNPESFLNGLKGRGLGLPLLVGSPPEL